MEICCWESSHTEDFSKVFLGFVTQLYIERKSADILQPPYISYDNYISLTISIRSCMLHVSKFCKYEPFYTYFKGFCSGFLLFLTIY